jgi:GH15 family glucan-1,4-alpha-glucosidase
MSARIEDYALIGDCETAALVGRSGSIDWLCWPRFDSGACFAALLGTAEHGRWLVRPAHAEVRVTRRYREGTVILETDFDTPEGGVTLIDFMPVRGSTSDLIRMVRGRHGRVSMQFELTLRFDYGSVVPWVTRLESGMLRAVAGPDKVVLSSSVPLHGEELKTVGTFDIAPGESANFVLTYSPSHLPDPLPVEPCQALLDTECFWRGWSDRCVYEGRWPEAVKRSLITLKALTYAPTGGLVAAPTTSLPERIGGPRNWDYRFCWLRDATLTLLALMDAGYHDEARAWREWLLRAVAGSPARIQIMYGLAGERRLPEYELDWLPGYASSLPVRVGNGAARQMQLDVYGELMDAMYQAREGGIVAGGAGWELEKALISHLESIWEQPDYGIWEVRGPPQHFTHSKLMAWVALDRVLRSAEHFGLPGPVEHWRGLRERIHSEVCARGYDAERGAFVQAYGSKSLDASLLVLPLVGFLPPTDPRVQSTLSTIQRELSFDRFILRYDTRATDDGLPEGEGAFLPCSFWFVDNLMLQGRRDEAEEMFERLLAVRNDVGLLAEEYDPIQRRQLGNFPQAFSHLALVSSALNLARGAKPVAQRLPNAVPRSPYPR